MSRPRKIIDISLPLTSDLPVWPGDPEFELVQVKQLPDDGCNETRLQLGSHTGTHIDAPRHFIYDGATLEKVPLSILIGDACVVESLGVKEISADVLNGLGIPANVVRLLLKTENSELWRSKRERFYEDFAALTLDGAEWLVERGVKLVGIDYLSVQRFRDPKTTHEVLLNAGLVLLEGLDLTSVLVGKYELICLPLRVIGAEGAPARAILRSIDS